MRILVVQETDWIDRNPILHHRMLEALSVGGDEVTVLDYEILWGRRGRWPLRQPRLAWTDVSKFLPDSRVTVIRPAMLRVPGLARPSWLVGTLLELRRYFRAGPPDVIVGYGISNSLLAWLFARRHRVAFVVHLFDSLHALAEPAVLRPLAAVVEGFVLRAADRVVLAHRGLGGYVARRGVRPDRLVVIPNGMTRRTAAPDVRAAMRSRLGIADGEIALLFIGWLYDHSGLLEVARELARDRARYARFRLVVVGDGDIDAALREIRDTGGLAERLILTGRRPVAEMADYIAASDVCLLPSTPSRAMRHVVPSKVDEYLELGRPVVSTRLEGMVAEFRDMAGIVWVDRPAEVLPRLDALLSGPRAPADVLAELSQACLDYAARRDDWETVTGRFRAVLSDAARSRGRHVSRPAGRAAGPAAPRADGGGAA